MIFWIYCIKYVIKMNLLISTHLKVTYRKFKMTFGLYFRI